MKTNKIKEEKKAWICKGCGLLIYSSEQPDRNDCSCGTNAIFYNDTQIDSLVKRQVKQATADFINDEIKFLEELVERKVGISAGIKLQIQVRLKELKQMLVGK